MKDKLQSAVHKESKKFEEFYGWIEKHMPKRFFEEVEAESIVLIVHSLMALDLSAFYSPIHLKDRAFVLCLDSPDADLRVLKEFQLHSIKNYRAFVSNESPPFDGARSPLRIAQILFQSAVETKEPIGAEKKKEIAKEVMKRDAEVTAADVEHLVERLSPLFMRSLGSERLILALDMFFRARTRDQCQYEVRYNEEWKDKKESPSMQIVFAWRNAPKFHFLYQMARVVHRHGLQMKYITATQVDPYSQHNILLLSLGLHGIKGGAAWEEADIADLLKELVTLKYFRGMEMIETVFVASGLLTGNQANGLKAIASFVHQVLLHLDVNMYGLSQIEEGLCRHPELTCVLMQAFEWKFHPEKRQLEKYVAVRETYLKSLDAIDTGNEINDARRKNILKQALNFIDHTFKTNFYRNNKTAFCFRLDPAYLDCMPFDRKEKFPELPFAVFFMKGLHFIGFHVRFRDLARGGLRTVMPKRLEQVSSERSHVFSECYNLAYTQNKKNKDIPEGGAKGVLFLEPLESIAAEQQMYKREMEAEGIEAQAIEQRLVTYEKEQKLETLYQTQRAYVESFMTLINCESDGKLRAKDVIDYYGKPEYIYLGPDENMHNAMIEWIADYSKQQHYKPKGAFISSKPSVGINHKEFGVTSLGVNVCMEVMLRNLGIDPTHEPFSIKMTGGPDGDVAGNQIYNLYRFYPKTARLLATIDVSGTIFDPQGLDLAVMATLFKEGKPLRFYPPEKLHEGGFLLDAFTKREQAAYVQQTLLSRKTGGKVEQHWLSGNEMNHLLRHNVHQVHADIFIPGGGRPRTLNETNVQDFIDPATGKPTARGIVEGANLYLTPWARRHLEKAGVLIIKDSSANKGGVICSSFEVLASLALSEAEFLQEKKTIVAEILQIIEDRAREEANLLLRIYRDNGAFLTDVSEWVSQRINRYKDELMSHLEMVPDLHTLNDLFVRCLLQYCPPFLRKRPERVLREIPTVHKKAIVACHIASRLVYFRGLEWSPSLVDVLPLIIKDPLIIGTE